ncbi:hypothetical protein BH10BAC5_BH10BAC5_10900 [soil metagenome]
MKKTRLLLSLLTVFISVALISKVSRADDDFTIALIKAKNILKTVENDSKETDLLKARGNFERLLQLKKNLWLVNFYLAQTDYDLAGVNYFPLNKDAIKKYNESGLAMINKTLEEKPDFAEAYVMKLSLEFNRWQYEPEQMNDIIAASQTAEDMALKSDPTNPRFYLVKGISLLYMPESFGGGADNSVSMLQTSEKYYGTFKPLNETMPDWGIEKMYGFMALGYQKLGKMDDAMAAYNKGIAANPDSGFLKYYIKKELDTPAEK